MADGNGQELVPASQWEALEAENAIVLPPVQTVQRVERRRSPAEVVTDATEQANLLMEIVERQGLASNIKGKKFLRLEAWQLIGHFNGCSAVVDWTTELTDQGKIIGYKAHVSVVSQVAGNVGSGEGIAFLDDYVAKGRDNDHSRMQAAISMAQTRAASKAFRLAFSHVAVLAGFEATPAEEMTEADVQTLPGRSGAAVAHSNPLDRISDEQLAEIKLLRVDLAMSPTMVTEAVKGMFGPAAEVVTLTRGRADVLIGMLREAAAKLGSN